MELCYLVTSPWGMSRKNLSRQNISRQAEQLDKHKTFCKAGNCPWHGKWKQMQANYLVNRQSEGQLANGTAKGTLSRNQQQGQGSEVQITLKINGNPVPYAGTAHSQLCRSFPCPPGDKGSAAVIPGSAREAAPLLTQQIQPRYHVRDAAAARSVSTPLSYERGNAPRQGYSHFATRKSVEGDCLTQTHRTGFPKCSLTATNALVKIILTNPSPFRHTGKHIPTSLSIS